MPAFSRRKPERSPFEPLSPYLPLRASCVPRASSTSSASSITTRSSLAKMVDIYCDGAWKNRLTLFLDQRFFSHGGCLADCPSFVRKSIICPCLFIKPNCHGPVADELSCLLTYSISQVRPCWCILTDVEPYTIIISMLKCIQLVIMNRQHPMMFEAYRSPARRRSIVITDFAMESMLG